MPLHLHKNGEIQLYHKRPRNLIRDFAGLTKNVEVVRRAQIAHSSMMIQPPIPGAVGQNPQGKAKGVEIGRPQVVREKEKVKEKARPRGAEDPHQGGKAGALIEVAPRNPLVPEPHNPLAQP